MRNKEEHDAFYQDLMVKVEQVDVETMVDNYITVMQTLLNRSNSLQMSRNALDAEKGRQQSTLQNLKQQLEFCQKEHECLGDFLERLDQVGLTSDTLAVELDYHDAKSMKERIFRVPRSIDDL